ncbi:MAG: T9SS type A sorting domain-containing protein [Bacteroidetes bacterium]|nr:T9SS type A sorting domain-containing protein [Bacteroidota bacterium]
MSTTQGVYQTTSKGDLWTLMSGSDSLDLNFGSSGNYDNLTIDPINNRLYAGTKNGLYVYDLPTSVETQAEIVPNEFRLYQNYPNPFNPTTRIKYQIQKINSQINSKIQNSKLVVLKVYDILGKEVTTLVNDQKQPGTYEVEFNSLSIGGKLPSGVYFYQLKVASFSEVKKMILIE